MKKVVKTVSVTDKEYMSDALRFVEDALKKFRVPKGLLVRSELLAEEIIVAIKNHGTKDTKIDIRVTKRLGDVHIDIEGAGKEIDVRRLKKANVSDIDDSQKDMDDPALEKAIRAIIVKAQGEKLKYSYDDGVNRISIAVGKAERSSLIMTLNALIFGIIFGLAARFIFPDWLSDGLCRFALDPVKTMFMNALRIIVGPVVFFSIVTCLSQFKNLSELGRVGAKVMGMYVITTVVAAAIALFFSRLFDPGVWGAGLSAATAEAVNISTDTDTSLLTTIINIVPDNFVKPFLESDTLQLIFLAVVCGIAVGAIGEYSKKLASLLEALNELFLAITTMFSRFIPLAAFCSVVLMIVQLGSETLMSLLGMCGVFFISVACMILVYGLLVMIIGHMSPVMFYKKAREGMLTSFALSSSSAAMPTNLHICTDKLGVAPKLASFSIPLGATVNMDGSSINLIVVGLFLAKMYAVPVTGSTLASLIVTVIMLSLGAPGVPGAGLVCLGIILEHLGAPIEAIGLVMAIDPFLDMFSTMNNVTGDMAVTTIVAKTEGMLDTDMYNKDI